MSCIKRGLLPNNYNWGLPSFLGFTRKNVAGEYSITKPIPRFYYGNVVGIDDGYWCIPVLPGATVYTVSAPLKINFMGQAYMYMEIPGLNCIDETSPYSKNSYTEHTNGGTSIVDSCFSKIPIPTTPIGQWFDGDLAPYKYYNPPLERLRKIHVKMRYHDGQIVDFGAFNYSFMIELNIIRPQQERKMIIKDSFVPL